MSDHVLRGDIQRHRRGIILVKPRNNSLNSAVHSLRSLHNASAPRENTNTTYFAKCPHVHGHIHKPHTGAGLSKCLAMVLPVSGKFSEGAWTETLAEDREREREREEC
jgi:hypothetical protein